MLQGAMYSHGTEFRLKDGFVELQLVKARLCAVRKTVRFKTDFIFVKKKKSHKWFFTVTASVALCFLDHTLSDLGRHTVPKCKLSPGPLTFCTQFPVLPLYPLLFRTAHSFRENHLSFTFISRLLFLFAFLHVPAHVQSFPVPVQPEMTTASPWVSLSALFNPPSTGQLLLRREFHSFIPMLILPTLHSLSIFLAHTCSGHVAMCWEYRDELGLLSSSRGNGRDG